MNMINARVECNIVSVLSFVHFLPQITESLCIQAGGPSLIGVEEIHSKHWILKQECENPGGH